jgi:hypothetical protein
MISKLLKDTCDLNALSAELERSILIRKHFNLGNDGVITTRKIKPAGASMTETHKHIVRIYKDGSLVDECKLPEFNAIFEG